MTTASASLFNERRAAQCAAFLLYRAGGHLPLIKLVKLLYLAERQSLLEYGEPLTGDKLVSMEHGPVLSRVYNHINGSIQSAPGGWEEWVSDRTGHQVALRDPSMIRSPEQDLTALSDSDLEVLQSVWDKFGHVEKWALVEYTHSQLPEWDDPNHSSKPIEYERLFSAVGYSETQTALLVERLAEQEQLNAAFI